MSECDDMLHAILPTTFVIRLRIHLDTLVSSMMHADLVQKSSQCYGLLSFYGSLKLTLPDGSNFLDQSVHMTFVSTYNSASHLFQRGPKCGSEQYE